MKQKFNIWLGFGAAAAVLLPGLALAAGLVPCGGPTEGPCTIESAFVMLARIIGMLHAFAGMVAVFFIVWRAQEMMTSAGNTEAYGAAKKGLTNAVVGMVITLTSFLLVNQIIKVIFNQQIDLANPLCYVNKECTNASRTPAPTTTTTP